MAFCSSAPASVHSSTLSRSWSWFHSLMSLDLGHLICSLAGWVLFTGVVSEVLGWHKWEIYGTVGYFLPGVRLHLIRCFPFLTLGHDLVYFKPPITTSPCLVLSFVGCWVDALLQVLCMRLLASYPHASLSQELFVFPESPAFLACHPFHFLLDMTSRERLDGYLSRVSLFFPGHQPSTLAIQTFLEVTGHPETCI